MQPSWEEGVKQVGREAPNNSRLADDEGSLKEAG